MFLPEIMLHLATRWQSRGVTCLPKIVESLKINVFIALLIGVLLVNICKCIYCTFETSALVNIWSNSKNYGFLTASTKKLSSLHSVSYL